MARHITQNGQKCYHHHSPFKNTVHKGTIPYVPGSLRAHWFAADGVVSDWKSADKRLRPERQSWRMSIGDRDTAVHSRGKGSQRQGADHYLCPIAQSPLSRVQNTRMQLIEFLDQDGRLGESAAVLAVFQAVQARMGLNSVLAATRPLNPCRSLLKQPARALARTPHAWHWRANRHRGVPERGPWTPKHRRKWLNSPFPSGTPAPGAPLRPSTRPTGSTRPRFALPRAPMRPRTCLDV